MWYLHCQEHSLTSNGARILLHFSHSSSRWCEFNSLFALSFLHLIFYTHSISLLLDSFTLSILSPARLSRRLLVRLCLVFLRLLDLSACFNRYFRSLQIPEQLSCFETYSGPSCNIVSSMNMLSISTLTIEMTTN